MSEMNYKLLALDLDGTLMDNSKKIKPEVRSAIDKLRNEGGIVLLASGRPADGIYPVAKMLDMDIYGGYILAYNGGKIIDYKTGEVVYSQTIEPKRIGEIKKFLEDIRCGIVAYKNGEIITMTPEDEYIIKEANINQMPIRKVEDLWAEIDFPVDKLLLTGDPDYLRDVVEDMARRFYGILNIFRSEPFFIEVVPLGIDKAKSLSKLLEKLGYTRNQLVACGDGYNDITMVEYAGLGVAMDNGCDEIKKKADYICPSNEEAGVAHVIEKFFLGLL